MLKSLSLTSVVLALGVLASPAVAAPASNLQGLEAANPSLTEQVGYRRCVWRARVAAQRAVLLTVVS